MKIKVCKIYYCDFCGKHRHFSGVMAVHEKHCTMNPNRECRMCERIGLPKETIASVKRAYKTLLSHKIDHGINGVYVANFNKRIEKLYQDLGCPACMLAVLRQHQGDWMNEWDFQEELKKYWEKKREQEQREVEHDAIYG